MVSELRMDPNAADHDRTAVGVAAGVADQLQVLGGKETAFLNHVLGLHMELADDARNVGHHRYLHLHRLEDDDLVALGDHLALVHGDLPDVRGDLSPDLVHAGRLAPRAFRRA